MGFLYSTLWHFTNKPEVTPKTSKSWLCIFFDNGRNENIISITVQSVIKDADALPLPAYWNYHPFNHLTETVCETNNKSDRIKLSFKRLVRLSYFTVAIKPSRLFPDYYWLFNIAVTSHFALVYDRTIMS